MITENYISFETAKLLKEKGFDEATLCDYSNKGTRWFNDVLVQHNSQGGIACPTLQMAMKWLREIHHMIIVPQPLSFLISKGYPCKNWVYSLWVEVNLEIDESLGNQTSYPTYEQACEAAIQYCLKNLIQ